MTEHRNPGDMTATDRAYLKGGFGYCPKWGTRFLRSRTSLARMDPKGDLLDAGCGDGFWTRILRDLGWHCTGADLSKIGIQKAKEADPEGFYRRDDVLSWVFEDANYAGFDVVFCRAPSFLIGPRDESFADDVRKMVNMACELFVWVGYSRKPYDTWIDHSYYHDPFKIAPFLAPFGKVEFSYDSNYFVAEVDPR